MDSHSVGFVEGELDAIAAIAESGEDRPVLMLNLNRYAKDSGYPDGALYRDYMAALDTLLSQVGGWVLWRSPVFGQAVGEQPVDEVIAIWYPSHRAFLNLRDAPGTDENARLRELAVEYAVVHRCLGDRSPLSDR